MRTSLHPHSVQSHSCTFPSRRSDACTAPSISTAVRPASSAAISRFTYAQFGERCERLAAGLLSEGVAKGDRVAYLSFNTHQLLEGYFGVLLAGAVVMPLNVRLTPFELAAILNHAAPRFLIYEPDFAPLIEHLRQACSAIHRFIETGPAYEEFLTARPH